MRWLPGLDVVIEGAGGGLLLERAVFSAAMQDVRPVTLHVVCAGMGAQALAGVRAALGPLVAVGGDVGLVVSDSAAAGVRRYGAVLGVGDVVYPEGWRLLISALAAGEAAMAGGAVLEADVRWGTVPYVAGKRRRETAGGVLAHGCVVDRSRQGGGWCGIEAVVGEAWGAVG